MQCIFLFRDARGRLPTAGELAARGFVVSEAVLPAPGERLAAAPEHRALAAEDAAEYGGVPAQGQGEAPGPKD